MAFIPALFEAGELLWLAYEATEVAEAAGVGAGAYQALAVTEEAAAVAEAGTAAGVADTAVGTAAYTAMEVEGVGQAGAAGVSEAYAYDMLASEEAGEAGYAVDGGPDMSGYYGPQGDYGYMRLPLEEEGGSALADIRTFLREDEVLYPVFAIGSGKAVVIAGTWWLLDPLTGAPLYAIAGDDPRLDAILKALGYTNSAKEYGKRIREWFGESSINGVHAGVSSGSASQRRRPQHQEQEISTDERPVFSLDGAIATNSKMSNRKRMRTGEYVAAVPRPMGSMMVPMKRRTRRPTAKNVTVARTLGRIITGSFIYPSSGGTMLQYQILDPPISGYANSGGSINTNGVAYADGCFGIAFKLSDFGQASDVWQTFDQYRIKSAYVTFIPAKAESDISTAPIMPVCLMCEDHDDLDLTQFKSGPTNMLSKSGVKWTRYENPIAVKIKPQAWVTDGVGKTKVNGGWIPSTNLDVPHYGLKFCVAKDTYTAGVDYKFSFMIKIVVEGKHYA